MSLSLDQGTKLVRLARQAINSVFNKKEAKAPTSLNISRGIFVTLKRYPKETLKGCIGFIYPIPLGQGVIRAAQSAAFEDPRFPPLKETEFKHIVVEISFLTEPKEIELHSEDDLRQIKIGRDGLIVSRGSLSGLLLPQVATEEHWDARTFIRGTCMKAGLGPEAWRDRSVKIFKFQAQIFKETSPEGEVIEESIEEPVKKPKRKRNKRPKRNFVLFVDGKNTDHVFSGFMPRDAALKAASRDITNIILRERGTKKLHIFEGSRELVPAPVNRPDWMPEEVWKPNVKKIRVEHLK